MYFNICTAMARSPAWSSRITVPPQRIKAWPSNSTWQPCLFIPAIKVTWQSSLLQQSHLAILPDHISHIGNLAFQSASAISPGSPVCFSQLTWQSGLVQSRNCAPGDSAPAALWRRVEVEGRVPSPATSRPSSPPSINSTRPRLPESKSVKNLNKNENRGCSCSHEQKSTANGFLISSNLRSLCMVPFAHNDIHCSHQRWKKTGLLASGRPAQLTSRGKFLRSRGITLLIRHYITFF